MRRKLPDTPKNLLALIVMGAFIIAVIAAAVIQWQGKKSLPPPETKGGPVVGPIAEKPVIAYSESGEEDVSKEITEQRKAQFGMDKGVDLIVLADESVKIGDTTVSMQEILNRIRLKKGDIVEKGVADSQVQGPGAIGHRQSGETPSDAYGIYIVQPKDNIWNVHFQFFRDYFKQRGVTLSPVSDEPTRNGRSSGVGKILKFSENMVYIYNLRERKLDVDLNLIHPLNKIVIFDMGQVFSLLGQIDITHVNHIQFDGETLWIPAKQ